VCRRTPGRPCPRHPHPSNKRKIGEFARSQSAHARNILLQYDRLAAAPAQLRAAVRDQYAVLAREEVAERLAKMPAGDLKKVAKGMRLGKLEQAGFSTVALIRSASHHRLQQVPGVGAQTVEEVKAAADLLAERAAADTRPRLDPVRKDPRHTRILATLAAERAAGAAADGLRDALQRFKTRTAPHIAAADRAASKTAMFWSGRKRKAEALAGLDALEAVIADFETGSLVRSLAEALERADPGRWSADELWRDFELQAANVNTSLAKITGADIEDAARAEDFVSPELRQKIEALPFDASLMRTDLRFYQLFGAKYTIHQEQAIIGDEMGLGKTIQALAVAAHLAAKGQRRFLVVCPASVVPNWLNEIRKHTHLASFILHGSGREAEARKWLHRGGVAVTTFNTIDRLETLRRHADAETALLVVDEAHYIKNPGTKRTQAVRAAIGRSQRTLFLSGTPMENRVEEFQALIGYLRPDIARRVDAGDAVVGARAFRRLVAPVYLRRNQEDVLTELPEKIEVEEWVQFTGDDANAYRDQVRARNLMGMRRASSAMPGTAKLDRLAELVEDAGAEGQKVIVFSYFLDVLAAAGSRLGNLAIGPITGSVPAPKRQDMIDDFTRREGPAVILAQIEAGGVGLNIQAASVVVIAEPQWKPSVEQQAIARAHRMGQTRRVQVHRLLAKDGVDERIREVQEQKQLLFEHYARQSDAKSTDGMATDTGIARPAPLDDDSIPLEQRIIVAERARLGL
jgi:superfamily II DNA or RNA helicase